MNDEYMWLFKCKTESGIREELRSTACKHG